MSTYQPNIPTGLVNLDSDYTNIRGNFQQLNTTYGIDHFEYSNQTANNGNHKKSTYISGLYSLASPPASIAGQVILYAANTAPGNILAMVRDGQTTGTALTTATNTSVATATNGYTFLPGGLIFQWGRATGGASQTVKFTLSGNIDFLNAIFNVQITKRASSATGFQSVSNELKTGFDIESTLGGTFYWTAIGN